MDWHSLSGSAARWLPVEQLTDLSRELLRQIAAEGGWPVISGTLRRDAGAEDIERLRQRLSAEGDLPQNGVSEDTWDDTLTDALKSFQRRAGLEQSGELDKATLNALNVPAEVRARELEASADRIAGVKVPFDQPYIVVNIPSASVEAVKDLRVTQRYAAIAGRVDHPSPQLTAAVQSITLNPTWTIPRSIVERELVPKLRRDPRYLRRAKLLVLDPEGRRVSLRRILRSGAANFTFKQEPGAKNALGRLRIDIPNSKAVYMHDTPIRRLLAENYRFLSHGCVRVDGAYDLAAWLLNRGSPYGRWNRETTAEAVRTHVQRKIKLPKAVPVAWVYLDAWQSSGGVVHFAPDVYDLDGAKDKGQAWRKGRMPPQAGASTLRSD